MRTRVKTVKPTYLSISRSMRYSEIEQGIGERCNHPFVGTMGKFLALSKTILASGKVFNEEGC